MKRCVICNAEVRLPYKDKAFISVHKTKGWLCDECTEDFKDWYVDMVIGS